MKIQPRYTPYILITAFVVFLLIGFLLGFLPGESGGQGHGREALLQFACLALRTMI